MICKHGEPLRFLGGNICIKETEIMIEKKFVCDFTLNSDACHKALTWSYSCDTCSCSHEGDVYKVKVAPRAAEVSRTDICCQSQFVVISYLSSWLSN